MGLALLFGMPLVSALVRGDRRRRSIRRADARGRGRCLPGPLPPSRWAPRFRSSRGFARNSREGRAWLGYFYAGNLAGAVAGCLLAGFYLLRVYDMAVATYVAVAINLVVGAAAWWAGSIGVTIIDSGVGGVDVERAPAVPLPVYVAIALSGFNALAAEVIWTRFLGLTFGATVYTFSIVLAVFLIGLGMGSSIGAAVGRRVRRPALALGVCQLVSVIAIVWSARMLSDVLPFWPIDPSVSGDIWVDLPHRSGACGVRHSAGPTLVGRQLSARAGGRRQRRRGQRADRRSRVRGEHHRGDRRSAGDEPGACADGRIAAHPAGDGDRRSDERGDTRCGGLRAAPAHG